jgi:hypothetical protein
MQRTLLFALIGLGCSPAGSPDMSGPTAPGYARVALSLSSSSQMQTVGKGSVSDLSEMIVDVDRVTAHAPGGWVGISDEEVTVDILRLGDYAVPLGFADLPAGKITQIRLHVLEDSAPFVTLAADGSEVPLKVPSGMQSGIKLKGPWDLEACTLTNITLDLDRKKSIHVHPTGHEDLWILRPVIRIGGGSSDVGCDDGMTPPGENEPSEPNQPNDPNGPNDPNDPNDPNQPGPTDPSNDPGAPSSEPDADGDGVPDSVDGDPSGPGEGYDPTDPGAPGLDQPGGGSDPAGGDPSDPSATCANSIDCGATDYCSESGFCQPIP